MRYSLVALFLIGCGGSDTAAVGAADSGSASDGNPDPTPVADGGGPLADGAVTPDASTTPPADDRIDPISLGRRWTYDVSIIGTYPLCRAGSSTAQVLGQKTVGGKPAFEVQSFCPGAGTSSYAVDGDKVEIYYANTWVLSLDTPVTAGHSWTDGLYTYAWQDAGSVTTPAGKFDHCWTAQPSVGTSSTTFCRGVGPVHWHYVDGSGNGYDAMLTGTSQ